MVMNAADPECETIQVTEKQWNVVASRHAVTQRACVRRDKWVKGMWMQSFNRFGWELCSLGPGYLIWPPLLSF